MRVCGPEWLARSIDRRSSGTLRQANRLAEKRHILIVRGWHRISLLLLFSILTGGRSEQGIGAQKPAQVTRSITLKWRASASAVIGYYVYRGTHAGGPYTKLNFAPIRATSYDDNTVRSGMTYFYVVTSVDANRSESQNSKEVSVTIPK